MSDNEFKSLDEMAAVVGRMVESAETRRAAPCKGPREFDGGGVPDTKGSPMRRRAGVGRSKS